MFLNFLLAKEDLLEVREDEIMRLLYIGSYTTLWSNKNSFNRFIDLAKKKKRILYLDTHMSMYKRRKYAEQKEELGERDGKDQLIDPFSCRDRGNVFRNCLGPC